MNDSKLLIVSIFSPSKHNRLWYDVQSNFVRRTTVGTFDYILYLNGITDEVFPNGNIGWRMVNNKGHGHALNEIQRFFRSQSHQNYERFLILDSDCFPIFSGWNTILDRQMAQFAKDIAAPVRTENLDLFPHPCAFYMSAAGVQNENVRFEMARKHNMLGQPINDVCAHMTSWFDRLLPMMRTNIINLHPVAAAIYHHLFYHHGAGSRTFKFRVTYKYRFYEHYLDDDQTLDEELMREFSNDPEGFLCKLVGKRLWKKGQQTVPKSSRK